MRQIKIGNSVETVVERADYPPERVKSILGKETVAVLGYGTQGRGQSLNMKDNGVNVIVGLREKGKGWDLAQEDGWQPGKTLLSLDEAARRGTIIQYLLSDAGQKEYWPKLKPQLTAGKALYFSHGFSIVYADQTGVIPSKDIDVILVAPKGSGTTVRRYFLEGKGINSSYAVHQDATGRALDRCLACGIAIGSGYLFETTFQKEVFSDLTGERGVLMGAIYGLWLAQYEVLREHGHGFLAENGFPSLGRIVRSFDHGFHAVADFDLAHAGFLLLAHHKDTKGTKISNNFLCALCAFVVHFLVNWPSCTFTPTILYI